MNNKFYVYIYLDPRKAGNYQYGKYTFNYEPFYVGKGSGIRYKRHLYYQKHYNPYFFRKINSIIKETNKNPIILIYQKNLNENEAFNLEMDLIKTIGRNALTNLTDGGEGVSGWAQNKTYEEMYGKERAQKIKLLRATQMKKRLKGKTYEELYGKKVALKKRKKQSEFMKNNNPMYSGKVNFKDENNPNSKEYLITDPKGNKHFIRCLNKFCKENNLNPHYMSRVAQGKQSHHKGWKCEYCFKNSLAHMNVEISSLCNKKCIHCGRREREKIYGNQNYGFMDFKLLQLIAKQTPPGITIALHNSGEPLLYPKFGQAVKLFKHCITYIVTNGKLIIDKANEIINNLDVMSISIIQDDNPKERDLQIKLLRKFLKLKGNCKPMVTLRFVGKIDESLYEEFNLLKIRRVLHAPQGSINYQRPPTIPEHGICWELLSRLAIDRFGYVSVCVRFDPEGELILGNIKEKSLIELWNSPKRKWMLNKFIEGKRNEIPYCGNKCDYWGCPTGY